MITNREPCYRIHLKDFDPFQTFLCGQCFRWEREEDGLWTGIVFGRRLRLSWENGVCTLYGITEQQFFDQYYQYLIVLKQLV